LVREPVISKSIYFGAQNILTHFEPVGDSGLNFEPGLSTKSTKIGYNIWLVKKLENA